MPNRAQEKKFAEILFDRFSLLPNGLVSDERPDLRFELNGKSIGMEVTECTPEEHRRAEKLSGKITGPVVYCTSHLREPDKRRTNSELFHSMFNKPAEYVDLTEERREWCERLRTRIEGKRAKLSSAGYTLFEENWLLVWDNFGLREDIVTLSSIQRDVQATVSESKTGEREFDHVFVLSGGYSFDIIPGKVAFFHENAAEINTWINGGKKHTCSFDLLS